MSWPDSIHTVFLLCHSQKEPARFNRLIPHLLVRGIPKEHLKLCAPTWGDSLKVETIFNVYDPYLQRGGIPSFSFKAAALSKGEISLNLNFFTAIQSAKDISDNQCIMILESDVYLRRDFVPRLQELMTDLSGQEWDYISLSEGVGSRPEGHGNYYSPTKGFKPPHSGVFRCTDSMILSKSFLTKLCTTFLPFKECLDWELNFQISLHRGKAIWADPPLVEQGTMACREKSSLP